MLDLALVDDEETLQVYVEGKWHRRFLQRDETACGEIYNSQFATPRRDALDGPLCGNCFTIRERAEAARLERVKYGLSHSDHGEQDGENGDQHE